MTILPQCPPIKRAAIERHRIIFFIWSAKNDISAIIPSAIDGHHHRSHRLALDVPAKGAEFDIMIETRDARHTEEIMEALRARGYPPRAV